MIVENKQSGIGVIQYLKKMMVPVKEVTPSKDKVTRALDAQPSIEAGYVFLPDEMSCSWIKDLTDESEKFPVGKHDDQVDCLVMAVIELCLAQHFETPIGLVCPTIQELAAEEADELAWDVFGLRSSKPIQEPENPWIEMSGI